MKVFRTHALKTSTLVLGQNSVPRKVQSHDSQLGMVGSTLETCGDCTDSGRVEFG